MSVPLFREFFKPILTFMSNGDVYTPKNLKEQVIEYFNLNETDINEKTEGGRRTKVQDRVKWTISYFTKSMIIKNVSHGKYQITSRGKKVYENDIEKIDIDYLMKFKEFREYKNRKPSKTRKQKNIETNQSEEQTSEVKKKQGFVYYIQEEMDGNIKIGWSDDPVKRLSQHQTSNSRELRMLVYVRGSQEYEREIHRKFQSSKTTGEWFKPDKRLLVYIEHEKSKLFNTIKELTEDVEDLKSRLEKLENGLN